MSKSLRIDLKELSEKLGAAKLLLTPNSTEFDSTRKKLNDILDEILSKLVQINGKQNEVWHLPKDQKNVLKVAGTLIRTIKKLLECFDSNGITSPDSLDKFITSEIISNEEDKSKSDFSGLLVKQTFNKVREELSEVFNSFKDEHDMDCDENAKVIFRLNVIKAAFAVSAFYGSKMLPQVVLLDLNCGVCVEFPNPRWNLIFPMEGPVEFHNVVGDDLFKCTVEVYPFKDFHLPLEDLKKMPDLNAAVCQTKPCAPKDLLNIATMAFPYQPVF